MRRSPRSTLTALAALVLAVTLTAAPARAQSAGMANPQPIIPDTLQRSGLLSRYTPVTPTLPHDPDRDTFYATRWNLPPDHPNCIKNSGLYGTPLKSNCTASVYPYFFGSPGQSSIGPDCRRVHPRFLRVVDNFVHPWRPVGMYYEMGSYAPVYDLDPIAPGPGPFPYPVFWRGNRGG